VNNNHLQSNGDGQHNRITASINFNINNEAIAALSLLAEESWIHELFQGTLVSTTKCLNCETVYFAPLIVCEKIAFILRNEKIQAKVTLI
jgi:hypothetical protein